MAVVLITSITLLVIIGSVYLQMCRQVKPRINIYFPDGLKKISYRAKEETNISLHIKNIGRFALPKPVATKLNIYVYTPSIFVLKKFQCCSVITDYVKQATSGGIFGGMKYMGGALDVSLFYKEEEVVTLTAQMPEKTGNYKIKVPISSDQGDLGIHEVEIDII